MVEIVAINWIIIVFECLIGIIWASVFFNEFFPFIELNRVKYKFSEKYDLVLKKSFVSFLIQFFKFLLNAFLVALIGAGTFLFTQQEIPYVQTYVDPWLENLPDTFYFIGIGLLLLIIPKRVYRIIIPSYWIRQLKYFVLLGFVFLPLFLFEQGNLEAISELEFLFPTYATIVNLILPTQLLAENGYTLSLVEKQQLFVAIFIVVPFTISFLYQILPRFFRRTRGYGIFEWKEDQWQKIDDLAYEDDNDTAVLLLHGLGSAKEIWSSYSKERGTERIMDFIERNTDERYIRTKIFAIDFSDKLKNTFGTSYKMKNTETILGSKTKTGLNNYVWELYFAILLLKEVKEIERIHLIAHSSGGVIVRKLINEIYTNDSLNSIRKSIGYDTKSKTITCIDKISWLAVPHFGAKGGSSVILSIRDTFIFKYFLRILFILPFIETAFDRLGRMLAALGLDAQAAHDLDPNSGFIKKLNNSSKTVPLYGDHEYKNAYAHQDQVVGTGAIIGEKFKEKDDRVIYLEKEFEADHANAPWEQLSQIAQKQVNEIPPIHHSLQAIFWIMN